jgi:DNA-binding FadR family transcriptional regulator
MKRTTAVFSAAFLSLVLSLSSAAFAAPAPTPEAQPEMTAALEHLREAKKALESASHDKGGHRVKAIAAVNEAIRHVQEGIQYDNAHSSAAEKKEDKMKMEKH